MNNENKIICALDFDDLDKATKFIGKIEYDIIYKVGMEFFYNFGYEGINKLKKYRKGLKFFLDLKLHDIPNTVSRSIYPLVKKIKPYMITLHVAGGKKMLSAAVEAVNHASSSVNIPRPITLGVTILTSLKAEDLSELSLNNDIKEYVTSYARVAKEASVDGIVCSPLEIEFIKIKFGNKLKIITPGIRLEKNSNNDQSRVLTPIEAFNKGADYIVMGRPLIRSNNPNDIINSIIN
ncbi:MAG: orotidine-5'-phosphate decarboxylase [Rickettsiales bacterium]|nr:orotidine-5'-phosphate decarboxylase [Rickettsiales bacterium]